MGFVIAMFDAGGIISPERALSFEEVVTYCLGKRKPEDDARDHGNCALQGGQKMMDPCVKISGKRKLCVSELHKFLSIGS